tara:strand:- start:167 stop:745 length:579 start_codon:yes stop_codon:yes gene_type:complete
MSDKNTTFHHLFPSVIYEAQLNLNIKYLNDYCFKLKKSFNGVLKSNHGGWQSPSMKHSDLPTLSTEIEKHANIFKKSFLFKDLIKLGDMWININTYKDYNREHGHPLLTFAGVYYVKVPEGSGAIEFIHPAADLIQRDWRGLEKEKYNNYNSSQWSFEPRENMLFLFPSWLKHCVLPQENKEERVSISFNLK